LQTVGAGVPTLKLVLDGTSAGARDSAGPDLDFDPQKFTPIELVPHFNASPREFGPRERAKRLGGDPANDGLLRMPAGEQSLRGIPFRLGPEGIDQKCWLALSTRSSAWTVRSLEVPLQKSARFVCLAAFCDWDENETPPPGEDVAERVGQHLAM
jgi:hypothetical protein